MPGAPSNQPCLTVLGGPMSGTMFVIEDAVDNILIGSDSTCKFCIPLPGVSPIHARIWLDAGGTTVYDTHSPRGLYVNDDRVNGEAPLKNGDILWLGTPGEDAVVMIQCRLPRPATAPEGPPPEPEPPEATLVMASESVTEPPPESEFYVEVNDPEPSLVEPTTVLAGPPDEIRETFSPPPFEDPAIARLTPLPAVPPAPLETEFEDETSEAAVAPPPPVPEATREEEDDETVGIVPSRPPEPTPIPAPITPPAKAETVPVSPAPPAPRPAPAPAPRAAATPKAVSTPRAVTAPAPVKPPPAPTPVPRPAPAPSGSPAKGIVIGAGILAVVAVVGFFAWRLVGSRRTAVLTPTPAPVATRPPAATPIAPPPETSPPAVESPSPAPPVEEVVTIVKPPSPSPKPPSPSPSTKQSPSPKGPATPAPVAIPAGPSPEELRAQQVATQVAGLLGQADAAASRPEEALRLYEEALKLDPQNARAMAGKATAQGAAAGSRKRFAAGRTSIQSSKSKGDLSGFESADVQVADAPGRIDFEVTPASVKPGDSYTVKVFFANESKKAIKVKSLSVSTQANGARSGGPSAPKVREIAPGQRTLVSEVTGLWKDGTSAWSADAVMVSERNDTYRNQVSWR